MTDSTEDQGKTLPKPVEELNNRLGYAFENLKILELACIHKSFGNEFRGTEPVSVRNNERMEFLGDAILDLIVTEMLLAAYPESDEGDLSKLRAGLVNERTLARVARELELGDYIQLGRGESQTGGRDKDSILSSTFEAVVAAVFTDGGFPAATKWVEGLFERRIRTTDKVEIFQDYKTRLQEIVQARYKCAPRYEVVESSGPDHDKTFSVQLLINNKVVASATGKSKKEAEQAAARAAFEKYGPRVDL